LRLFHQDCGADAAVEIRCENDHQVPASELGVRLTRKSS